MGEANGKRAGRKGKQKRQMGWTKRPNKKRPSGCPAALLRFLFSEGGRGMGEANGKRAEGWNNLFVRPICLIFKILFLLFPFSLPGGSGHEQGDGQAQ